VLHVVESFAAGTGRHVLDLVRHVSDVDHVVAAPSHHVGASTAEAMAAARAAGARVELVEMGRSSSPHPHLAALRSLRQLLLRVNPHVVHGHSSIGGAVARLATLGTDIPTVYTPHALSRSRPALAIERVLRARTTRWIAVSESERRFAIGRRVADPERTVLIPNGIDQTPGANLAQPLRGLLGIGSDVPLVGSIGRLTWQKAPEVFVAACEIVAHQLPQAQFVLIGVGARHAELARMVDASSVRDRFHLVPSLPDAAAAISELDVLASSSRFEGAPYTPLEAMREGTPVVLTDVAGNRDVVRDGENGLLVPPDAPGALASAIVRLIDEDVLRRRVVANARRTVARRDVLTMAEATAAIYHELSAGRVLRIAR
jgi:glycosyltransferase involved in cell wall biosynthesis